VLLEQNKTRRNVFLFQARSVAENFKALEADYERLAAAGKATRQKFEDLQCVQQIKNDLDEVPAL